MTDAAPKLSSAEARRRHAIFGARARRLARPQEARRPGETITCLVCEAGVALYAIPLKKTARVTPFHKAAPAPATNHALIGIHGRAGVFYHVYDLGRLLGAASSAEGGHLVLLRGAPAIALRVDAALRVADLVPLDAQATSQMKATHAAVAAFAAPLNKDLFNGQAISVLDPDLLTSGPRAGRAEGDLRVDQ